MASVFRGTSTTASTILRSFFVPLILYSAITTSCLDIYPVRGRSMSPSLSPTYHTTGQRDWILIDKFSILFSREKRLKRGEIVAFHCPHKPDKMSVKRVVGIEGDTVFRDVRRVGSERRMFEEKGSTDATEIGLKMQDAVVKVPKMGVWVEGDYWRESLDSNDLGPISGALVFGRAVAVVWPPSRWQWLNEERKEGNKDVSRSFAKAGQVLLPPTWED